MKQLIPLCAGFEEGSVLTISAKAFPFSPLLMNIFLPFITYSSPSFFATVEMFCASLPASGSVRARPPLISPVAIFGRILSFCSCVPYWAIICPNIWWVPIMPDTLIQPLLNSSNIFAKVVKSNPSPPYSWGILMPNNPISRIFGISS